MHGAPVEQSWIPPASHSVERDFLVGSPKSTIHQAQEVVFGVAYLILPRIHMSWAGIEESRGQKSVGPHLGHRVYALRPVPSQLPCTYLYHLKVLYHRGCYMLPHRRDTLGGAGSTTL